MLNLKENWFPALLFLLIAVVVTHGLSTSATARRENEARFAAQRENQTVDSIWQGESENQIPTYTDSGKLIAYGRQLIANTAMYLGPKGSIATSTNGMNCQNCHLDAGTRPFGNNFGKVSSTYPQYRARNNGIQSVYGRINDCLQRSLNGKAMDSSGHEMQAMYSYIRWIGSDVPKGKEPGGTGLPKIQYLDRAADPIKGSAVYVGNCLSCHGKDGEGQPNAMKTGYIYPPLWGSHSYNDGAGLYRLSSFAGFIKDNMPYGSDYHSPRLSDEEAWDLAAFVNSQPRPHLDQSGDWAKRDKKPVDYPFGPYTDSFSERRHKYGPFAAIKAAASVKKM